ncbi:MAG: AI-2E family transporter [Bacteroidales bacterium]|nr:AI-2E family transporter [Bacteroidales bacterium]
MENSSIRRIILIVGVLLVFCAALWYFTDIFVYMFIALILSIIGSPLVRLLQKIHIGKHWLPDSAAAGITLVAIVAVLGTLINMVIPLISYEIRQLQNIDLTAMLDNLEKASRQVEHWLRHKHLVSRNFNLAKLLTNRAGEFVGSLHISSIFGDVISVVGSIFICIFSVLFMTFFALKDDSVFWTMIKKYIPTSLRDNFDNILNETKKQLRRYFLGVFIEMIFVGVLDGLICWALGIPNALLIGVIGGLLNIIPYVGPLLACITSVGIGVYATLTTGDAAVTPVIIKIVAAFGAVKLIDDFVLQPNIYGKSVNAHPLEIFIVILVAGKVGGVWGMLFGVPAYTVLRIVVREFFAQYFIPVQETKEPIADSQVTDIEDSKDEGIRN